MASFAGLRVGSRVSSLRAFSVHPLPALQLGRAPHFLLFSAARFSSSSSSLSLSSSSSSSSSSPVFQVSHQEELELAEDDAAVSRQEELELAEDDAAASPKSRPLSRKFPLLSPKEKKELRAYAHSLGKKIISQQIGKAGVTESLAKAMSDALEAKEILKLKVLDNCPDELDDVITKIEEATQGQVVGKIGSVLTIYRPSLRKLSEVQKSQNKVQQGRPRTMSSGRRV